MGHMEDARYRMWPAGFRVFMPVLNHLSYFMFLYILSSKLLKKLMKQYVVAQNQKQLNIY